MLLPFFIISALSALLMVLIRNRTIIKALTVLNALILILLAFHAWKNLDTTELRYFTFNSTGVLLLSVLSVLALPTVYHGFIYTRSDDPRKFSIYHSALVLLMTFMSGAYLANGMTVLWIFVEATTLVVAILIYHDRTAFALEATWKYVFICSSGIALAYLGILFLGFIYGREDAANLSFASLTELINKANPKYLKIAFLFVLVGFSTKMGLFPMHTAKIDATSVAPPPVGALISTTLMNVGFIAVFRVYTLFSSSVIFQFMNNVLIISGILSILVASGYMLKAKHLKRMLAYSSLELMGLVAVATGVGGRGYYAAILLIVLHSLVKSALFYQLGQLGGILGTYKLDECGRYMELYPAGALVLLIGLFSILAIPPSGLFVGEFLIFRELVTKEYWFVLIVTIILLCFIVYAMSTRFMHIIFSFPRGGMSPCPARSVRSIETVSQFLILFIVIVMCFWQPAFITDLINQTVAVLPK